MGLATVFKLSIYVLTGFVGLVLGAAEYGVIPFLSVPVTLFAYWWCETGVNGPDKQRGMSEAVARVLGFFALLAASLEFFSENQEGKLLAGIHLVVYLTWVVLLQQKSNYRYWLLMTLGMMHVAVGAVLTSATWYGLCMVAYLFGAIWTLSVFSLFRVAQEFEAIEPDSAGDETPSPGHPTTASRDQVFHDIRLENNDSWISFHLVSGVILTSLAGLVVGGAFYVLIPRVWVGSALGISEDSLPSSLRRSMTGQATEVRLGDLGKILASNDPVLSIRAFDNQTNSPIGLQAYAEQLGMREPLFRGAVLTEYDAGRWRAERASIAVQRVAAEPKPNDTRPLMRQEIRLERIGTNTLYCLGKPLAMRDPEGYRVALLQMTTLLPIRREWMATLPGAVDYAAFTETPLKTDLLDPGLIPTKEEQTTYRISNYMPRCQTLPGHLERLADLARQVRDTQAKQMGHPLSDTETARAIEAHLRDSGDFTYSLSTSVADATLDPVEDFLFNQRAGHCQYFASALALMLRAVGIPSRLVTGFKGGLEHTDGTLTVEKRFAHAWVEAWIDNRKWMTFDATPEDGRAESITQVGSTKNFLSALITKLTGIWESNILDLSYERQEAMIYDPFREWVSSVATFYTELWRSPQSALGNLFAHLANPRNWLSISGALVTLLIAAVVWLLWRSAAWLRWPWKRLGVAARDQSRRIAFYERFATLMKSAGRTRQPEQTQQEFVDEVASELSLRLKDSTLDAEVQSIAGLFYRVRFGDGELTADETARLDRILARLEQALGPDEGRRAQPA